MPDWNEDRVHRWLARSGRPAGVVGSAMHDAAALRALGGALPVVCVDQCIEGVHFDPGERPALIGRKAVHRALSDLAATAAAPVAVLLALRAAPTEPEARIQALVRAARLAAQACGAALVGGDLAAAPGPLGLTVTAIGRFDGRRPPGRDRARPGQLVVLTGPVGGSRAGRHLRFQPRLALGAALAAAGATALMDVSDGLAWDLYRLARASGVELELDLEAVPVHRDALRAAAGDHDSALQHALHDGEDHELLATLSARAARALCAGFRASDAARRSNSRGARPTIIGRVARVAQSGGGLWLVSQGRRAPWQPGSGGWNHGS
ncbi:MAG: thiamine-phosphate kinase [Planctomycetota bacterium]